MRLLRAADRQTLPWKNGGGSTQDILVWPPGSGLADFEWRVSMAQVETSGPFSVFEGVERILAIVTDGAIELSIAGEPARVLDSRSAPLVFDGGARTEGRLIAGAVADLNLMVRRDRWRGAMRRLHLIDPVTVGDSLGQTLIFALDPVHLNDFVLEPFDAVDLEPGEVATVRPSQAPGLVLMASIVRV